MSGSNEVLPPEDQIVQFAMPKAALQALYNAATGKTENLYRSLKKNVIINRSDVTQLYFRMMEQIQHYTLVAPPSVTIAVKMINDKVISYSSWERFSRLEISTSEITSEISLKFEFLVIPAGSLDPQRCIVSVSLDSGLSIIEEDKNDLYDPPPFLNIMILGRDYRTVEVSIGYVDFIIARIFLGLVEEWFSSLDAIPKPTWVRYLSKRHNFIEAVVNQFGRLGIAVFIASYVYLNHGLITNLGQLGYAISLSILIWALIAVIINSSSHYYMKTGEF